MGDIGRQHSPPWLTKTSVKDLLRPSGKQHAPSVKAGIPPEGGMNDFYFAMLKGLQRWMRSPLTISS
jgi:hypothetical protein